MKTSKVAAIAVSCFVLGLAISSVWAKKQRVDPSTFLGKEPKAAAAALLVQAEAQAGDGSWELIGVGRVYYLSGDKAKGQGYFDKVTSKSPKKNDWERIADVYMEAGEWDKAEPIYQKMLAMDPNDDSGQAKIGAIYNLKGQKEKAEELFKKSFANGDSVWNTLNAAGSYVGVSPK